MEGKGKGRRRKWGEREKGEKQKLPLQKKGWGASACRRERGVVSGSGRDLSLKGTGYPGDRPGQQIITHGTVCYLSQYSIVVTVTILIKESISLGLANIQRFNPLTSWEDIWQHAGRCDAGEVLRVLHLGRHEVDSELHACASSEQQAVEKSALSR